MKGQNILYVYVKFYTKTMMINIAMKRLVFACITTKLRRTHIVLIVRQIILAIAMAKISAFTKQ